MSSSDQDTLNLNGLYQGLKILEIMEQQLKKENRQIAMATSARPEFDVDGNLMFDENHDIIFESKEARLSRVLEALEKQEESKLLLPNMISELRQTLPQNANICSRSTIKPPTIMDLPGGIVFDENHKVSPESTETQLSRALEALRGREKSNILLQNIIPEVRQAFRQSANVCSRSKIRPLTILDLPDEILGQIFDIVKGHVPDKYFCFSFLNGTDIPKIRLTCKKFCNASSHLLYHHLQLDMNQESMTLLKNISKHPRISKGIETIHLTLRFYLADLSRDIYAFAYPWLEKLAGIADFQELLLKKPLPSSKTLSPEETTKGLQAIAEMRSILKSWELLLFGSPDEPTTRTTCFATRLRTMVAEKSLVSEHLMILKKAHGQYRHMFSQQQSLLNDNKFISAFATALSTMPKARTLLLQSRDFSWRRKSNPWMFDGSETVNRIQFIRFLVKPTDAYEAREMGLQSPGRVLRMPISLPIAIHNAGVRLRHYELDLSGPKHMSSLSLSTTDATKLQAAMQDLQCFRWKSNDSRRDDAWLVRDAVEMQHVEKLLKTFINTESLEWASIDLDSYCLPNEPPLFEMGGLMSLRSWPRLYSFDVDGMPFRLADIRALIDQMKKAPSLFKLEGYLLDGTWEEVLEILREKSKWHWEVKNPRGAECDQMSDADLQKIFEGDDSPANLYMRTKPEYGYAVPNPIRAFLDEQESQA